MRYTVFIICLLISSMSAFARGGDVSGGGYIVVCDEGATSERYELLDYFEAKQTFVGFELDDLVSYPGKNVFDKTSSLIKSRLQKHAPDLTSELVATVENFRDFDAKYLDRSIIVDINDNDTRVNPIGNCFKRQIAVQIKNPNQHVYRLLIDKSSWEKLNDITKIGLILHEALYKLALEQGHTNSNKVRYLNAALTNKDDNGSLPYTTELLEHFRYAQIEACWNMSVWHIGKVDKHQYLNIPIYLTSYHNVNSRTDDGQIYGGVVCKDHNIPDAFLAGNVLKLHEGTKVLIGRRASNDEVNPAGFMNIESNEHNGDVFSYASYVALRLNTRRNNNDIFYQNNFKINLKYPYEVNFARRSSLSLEMNPYIHLLEEVVKIDSCLNQNIVDDYISGCNEVSGVVELFRKKIDISKIFYGEADDVTVIEFSEKQCVDDTVLLCFKDRIYMSGKSYELLYDGVTKFYKFKGNSIQIKDYDHFVYNPQGVLIDITRNGTSIVGDNNEI